MMDPQQIRDALGVFGTLEIRGFEKTIHLAAAECADLLEASERVWWCETHRQGYESELICCSRLLDTNCGWRLLTPERTS